MLFLLLIRCFCFHSCFIIMQEEYDVYHQILYLMVGVYLHWQAPPSFRNTCNVYSWMVTSLQWTLCKKLNFSSALQMQSCRIISNTNCITGWSILYPSLKVRCHENSYGEVSKCYETPVRNRAGASTEHTSTSTGKSVLEYSVFSIFMFTILGQDEYPSSTRPSPGEEPGYHAPWINSLASGKF